ncbi:MAG: ASCH domain-containing protein [Oscillospiraceae bacterium]|nr:ASCH domain-containing protein [Oscillospiraceae bacterium]
MWARFVRYNKRYKRRGYSAWHFCNCEEDANALAELVKKGVKRATTSALAAFEHDGEPVPQPGDLSVILRWNGEAVCVVETTAVTILPFDEVTAEFAALEGEGDCSLEYWRRAHDAFLREECCRMGLEFSTDMPVVCEEFRLLMK